MTHFFSGQLNFPSSLIKLKPSQIDNFEQYSSKLICNKFQLIHEEDSSGSATYTSEGVRMNSLICPKKSKLYL